MTDYIVTNLSDSGPGSLREALTASGVRNVTFGVAGTIAVESPIEVLHPNLTVDGSTAPAGGVCIRNAGTFDGPPLKLRSSNITLRHLRLRAGPTGEGIAGDNTDSLSLEGASNVLVEHCSLSWAVDETVEIWNASGVTLRHCIISEGLGNSTHSGGAHSMGLICGGGKANNITITRCLFAHNNMRNPLVTQGRVDFINNVVYGWGWYGVGAMNTYGDSRINDIGNYYLPGAASPVASELNLNAVAGTATALVYREGNRHCIETADEWDAGVMYVSPESVIQDRLAFRSQERFALLSGAQIISAGDAYTDVTANAGATLPKRDVVDTRIINDVINGTGGLIDDPAEVGGWPDLTV